MRRPSRWTLWLLAFAVVGFAFYARAYLIPKRPPSPEDVKFDKETCDRIHRGMTRADVEALLGGPPRNSCPECVYLDWTPGVPTRLPGADTWVGEHGRIEVLFDSTERVIDKVFVPVHVYDKI